MENINFLSPSQTTDKLTDSTLRLDSLERHYNNVVQPEAARRLAAITNELGASALSKTGVDLIEESWGA